MRQLLVSLVVSVGLLAGSWQAALAQQTGYNLGGYSLGVAPLAQVVAADPGDAPPKSTGDRPGFFRRFFDAYYDGFKEQPESNEPEPARRGLPAAFQSPPYPGSEYQGYPLIGVPYSSGPWPLMKALAGTPVGDFLNDYRINVYGWVTGGANFSSSSHSNMPEAYWFSPNDVVLDQFLFRIERGVDTVQKDHIDWGFRSSFLYGTDYRYMTAGGWFEWQLLRYNQKYGFDPTEQYVDVYIPWIADGTIVRVGRWIACPDIETQFSVDNYMGSHSLLFTFDTYTQTGIMVTHLLNRNWMVQWGVHAGTDMAPWYKGAVPTGVLGVRWVSDSNNDSIYLVLNSINTAKFQRFTYYGQPAGHDNFDYLVGTWQHRFTESGSIHTKTEAYFMWQFDAVLGGTPSLGKPDTWGGGGGMGADIPGMSKTYGVVNYTMFQLSKKTYATVRNEVWRDEQGERTGFPSTYSSHTLGLSYQITDTLMVRPEIGYFHSYDAKAFDLGKKNFLWQAGVDMTVRF